MSKNNIFVCPTCGHQTTEYKHCLNKTLVACLWRLHSAGGRSRVDALGVNHTQFNNFQKLKYFHLVVHTGEHSEWQITRDGVEFLQGRLAVWEFVITRNAKPVLFSERKVYIGDVQECVEYKVEWKAQAAQPTLFDGGEQ